MMNENDLQRERAETIDAIRRGMKQAERGEALPLDEAARRIRRKHGFTRFTKAHMEPED